MGKSFFKAWIDAGWTSLFLAVLFLLSYLFGNMNYSLHLTIGFFIIALIQLTLKYLKK
jgi:phage-related holin